MDSNSLAKCSMIEIGVIEQIFQMERKTPSAKERLNSKNTGYIIEKRQLYKQKVDMLSGPLEHIFFSEFRANRTSSWKKSKPGGRVRTIRCKKEQGRS